MRKETLQGFVHDEASAFFGGLAGNAGLFSTARDVARVYQMLLNGGEIDGQRYLSKETCQLFTTETFEDQPAWLKALTSRMQTIRRKEIVRLPHLPKCMAIPDLPVHVPGWTRSMNWFMYSLATGFIRT